MFLALCDPKPELYDTINMIKRQKRRLVVVGLDGSGKTTILYKLKLGEVVITFPTIG